MEDLLNVFSIFLILVLTIVIGTPIVMALLLYINRIANLFGLW